MIEWETALRCVQEQMTPQQKTIEMPIDQSVGYVLAEDVLAPIFVPEFPRSAMDGYAVCSQDVQNATLENPIELPVITEILAGDTRELTASPKTAVRVMTGGSIPSGYDCVIKQENTDLGEKRVKIYQAVEPRDNYSPVGEDMIKGDCVAKKYSYINSSLVGLISCLGIQTVKVLQPIKVAIISTGDELVSIGTPLKYGQIYNSSSYMMKAAIQSAGGEVVFTKISPDNPTIFTKILKEAESQSDLIITTGGVSVGKKDFVPNALINAGATVLFHRINIKPGTPVMGSNYCGKVVLSFSGNPFAAFVNFHLFFWGCMAVFSHNSKFALQKKTGIITEGYMKKSGLRRFIRAYEFNNSVKIYTKGHQSSIISNLVEANCLISQPATKVLQVGDEVDIYCWKE